MENITKVLFGLLLLSMLAFPGVAAPVTNGLVASYDGNITGNVLPDKSEYYNNGYLINAAQGKLLSTGANYVSFSGLNSQANILNNASTNITSGISIEFIGSINNFSSYGAIVSKYHDAKGTGWYLSGRSDFSLKQVVFGMYGTDGQLYHFRSDAIFDEGKVYDIVATYDGKTPNVYVDGVATSADNTSMWNVPMSGNSYNTSIGYAEYGLNYLNCSMFVCRLYNRALTSSEVQQNYLNDKWRYVPYISSDISDLKKKAYGDGGLPRYMGSHAMVQSGSEVSLIDSNMSSLGSVSTPYYQDNEGVQTNYNLLSSSISGVNWKNYYAPGSSAALSFSGNNRNRLENVSLSNNSLDISNSVTYTAESLVTKDAVSVTGDAFQFYGDGLNTISGNTVQAYTDNGLIQNDCILNSTGAPIYNYYQNRKAGTTRSNSIELPLFSPQLTPMPCPSGYLGSLSFAIHADAQDPDSLKTLMYGTNDSSNSVYGKKGYIGHGLNCTWSAFAASSGGGVGFDNAAFKSTLDAMHEYGFEIIPHNVIGSAGENAPTLETTAYYLPWYSDNYSSRNWIDHGLNGGNRNTGLKSLGLENTSGYYIGDLLRGSEVQYAWAYQDAPVRDGISTSRIQSIGLPYDVVWTNSNFTWDDGTPMYEWTSTWAPDKTALDYFKNDTLQTMANNYGVCFWHDYTAQNDAYFENYYYTKGTPNMINQTYDNLLQNISEQKAAGRLWNPTVSQYIDYWRAACNVECKCTGQNTYTLTNHNSAAVTGYAMRVTGPYAVKLDGNSLYTKMNGANTVFWMNLSPGTHSLTLVEA
ncbi:hypothetical protein MSLAZ_1478 [Methanosarcina lacustris Z-7289]|uniref:LamG-like jellyroll fold domain-containing protein n=1 Tax=Methanosarcina lacustris Z-7289 TaxID=1434111 RepID=A0A0E3S1Z6_9EURY|nr:LamG-like jellyroll fold domain-containing protein [Methanosarcina lacustris]AKB74739.1 hypothetical protein MSLAZ_1478 [Methanosarcina lacustris Z-7289]